MDRHYDAIVIGLGVMGSSAAWHLARNGQRVLALEQFELDHRNGSSYGSSRIIRYAYDHPAYIPLAHSAYTLWRELEAESGDQLLQIVGGLDFGAADEDSLIATRVQMASGSAQWRPTGSPAGGQGDSALPYLHAPKDLILRNTRGHPLAVAKWWGATQAPMVRSRDSPV